ncbi:type II toxin-antitoxin system VapC family toxin [Geodermatophilus sp. URMC 62]|uniref:type II toxin-antitoxin system VapC family toxin n=1 Tax=Geodermatophilus sp. URMC 62 TaxID=3423414 RepID=UPI00406D42A0
MAEVVLDASAFVDLLLGNPLGVAVRSRLAGQSLHAPGHVDAEVLSALGRLNRAGDLDDDTVTRLLGRVVEAPIHRHPVQTLVLGAWARRHQLRLVDALYVELAAVRTAVLVTTDRRLRAVPMVDVVVA